MYEIESKLLHILPGDTLSIYAPREGKPKWKWRGRLSYRIRKRFCHLVLSLKKSTVETQMKMTGAFVVPD